LIAFDRGGRFRWVTSPKRTSIGALHKMDLESFLEGIGMLDAFVKGELRCCRCNAPTSRDNIGYIFPARAGILIQQNGLGFALQSLGSVP